MVRRRAKEKAEAAMQNSLIENERDLYSHVSADQAQTEERPTKECDPSTDEKADELVEMQAYKDAADVLDVTNMGYVQIPKEAPRTDSHKDSETPIRVSVVPFNTQDYRFECICGELGIIDYKARVQCMNCQLWQHASCVNYKEESLETTPFYCPHCLVAMKPVSTGATLIISPSSICHQWVEEINRHIRSSSLRVLVSYRMELLYIIVTEIPIFMFLLTEVSILWSSDDFLSGLSGCEEAWFHPTPYARRAGCGHHHL